MTLRIIGESVLGFGVACAFTGLCIDNPPIILAGLIAVIVGVWLAIFGTIKTVRNK